MKAAASFSLALFLVLPVAADWPGFRGPKGDGTGGQKAPPTEITKDSFVWKVKLPGLGASTPIITGDKVIVTCYKGYGTTLSKGMGKGGFGKGGFGKGGFGKGGDAGGDQKDLRLLVVCLDAKNGQVIWEKGVQPKLPEVSWTGFMREHGYASSTPVTDGKNVYVFFGKSGVFAFDLEGKAQWRADVGSGTDKWGSAASPVLFKNMVIVNAGIESKSLIALDKNKGTEVWRVKGLGNNWVTPAVVETKEGKHELVLSLPGKVVGYDPEKGTELWHCQGIGSGGGFGYTISTPVARDGIVYVIGGGGGPSPTPTALAVKSGGTGDVTKTHVLWRKTSGTSTASPVLNGDQLCFVAGSAICLNIADGKVVHQERLYEGRGEYVSAVGAGGKLYALTRFDGLFVLATGEKLEKLCHFEFEGDRGIFNASPAISDGRLFVRSSEFLYCIGKK